MCRDSMSVEGVEKWLLNYLCLLAQSRVPLQEQEDFMPRDPIDKPGIHNFKVLTKLVLPDGYILRARCAGRPTRDCLFIDPIMDGNCSLLKIWNMNKFSGIIGVFQLPRGRILAIETKPRLRVYSFSHLNSSHVFSEGIHFAPLGLIDMYNSRGAIETLSCTSEPPGCKIKIKAQGCGRFGAYSDSEPRYYKVDTKEMEFTYNANDGLLTVTLDDDCNFREIEIVY
ncbi:hypothetical protein C3L33_09900, partial [Rhododendron williamsianum]